MSDINVTYGTYSNNNQKVYISNDGVASEASAEIIEEGFLNG